MHLTQLFPLKERVIAEARLGWAMRKGHCWINALLCAAVLLSCVPAGEGDVYQGFVC